jgi:CPA2 family monovalent cation:H+ antiporter-2
VLSELKRIDNPETPTILSVLIIEDLAMAVYLPLVGVSLLGGGPVKVATSVSIAVAVVILVLFLALKFGRQLNRFVSHQSEEIILLSTFGLVLLVAGLAARFQVSAEIGAFLVGIALSGPAAEQSHKLLSPLRDLFAAIFFFFFGLQIDPATLPPALPLAVGLGLVTALTKVLTGYWAAKRAGVDRSGSYRAGMTLVARGEFSIVIAGLGAGIEPALGPLAAAYVLFLAIVGPMLARFAK